MRIFWLALVVVLMAGCGYKPSSYYTKKVFGDSIYAKVTISPTSPENSIMAQDAINEAIISKFKSKLTSEERADTKLYITLAAIGYAPLQYDSDGFATLYRTTVTLSINAVGKAISKAYAVSGNYDYSVTSGSISSELARQDSIKNGALIALDSFTSQVVYDGFGR